MNVDYIDHLGSDLSIVNAARVSFNKESDWEYLDTPLEWSEEGSVVSWDYIKILKLSDRKLIKYLADHGHFSPFGHCFLSFRVEAPVFVARQLVKHEYLRMNEVSRRYVDDTPEFYYPEVWRTKPVGSIKQGSGTEKLPEPEFEYGYCRQCGKETEPSIRSQGGGKARIYCSDVCKYKYNNLNRNPYKAVWNNALARAKREGKEWTIDFDTFEFPSHCPILGVELDYSLGKGGIQDNSPSFDRIDSTKEYLVGNVRLISNKANTMKSNATPDELVTFAKAILLQHKGIVVKDDFGYDGVIQKAKELYNIMIKEGYSAEQARMVLPQAMMTTWWWSGSLDAFANMYNLRSKEDTQKETREVALAIGKIAEEYFPVGWRALVGQI